MSLWREKMGTFAKSILTASCAIRNLRRPRPERHAKLLALLLCGACVAGSAANDPGPRDLEPRYSFQLAERAKLNYVPQIWRIRAAQGKLWILWSSPGGAVRYYLASMTFDGKLINYLPLDPTAENADIALTSNGFSSLISRRSAPRSRLELILSEHDEVGNLLWQTSVPCGGMDALTTVNGRPALLCSDGALRIYGEAGRWTRRQTWGRRGVICLTFGSNRLGLVDQATAQVLLQDLESSTASPVAWTISEITESKRRIRETEEEMAKRLGPEQVAEQTSLIVIDAASDGATGALLIFPHRPLPDRISVIRLDSAGRLIGRYRCRFNRSDTPVRIALGGGYLVLAGGKGQVYVYSLNDGG
jgi:hypothetical protein